MRPYGSDAELSSVVDSFGRQLTFTWLSGDAGTGVNQDILIDKIELPDGTALNYDYTLRRSTGQSQYDYIEKVQHLVSSAGSGPSNLISETTYHHEDGRFPSFLTGVTDARGVRYATWAYDGYGRAISSEHGNGVSEYTFAYSVGGAPTTYVTVTNPSGKDTIYTYDRSDRYKQIDTVEGEASTNCPYSVASYTWNGTNGNHLVDTFTDEEGFVTKINRAVGGLPSSIVHAYGTADARTTSYTWRADQQLDTVSEPGLDTEYNYGATGELLEIIETDTTGHSVPYTTNGDSRTWTFTYTSEGLLESVDGPLAGTGDTVDYAYDADGYLESVTDELGHTTEILSVDGTGRPLEIEDSNGIVTELAYNDSGYLETITEDAGGADVVTTVGYNEVGDVTSVIREDGSEYTFDYDDARRLTSVTDASGNVATFTLDNMGGITQTEIENGSSTQVFLETATFDELGRLLTQVGVGSATWEYEYDKTSNLVSTTDPRTNESTQGFNGLRELVQAIDENSNATTTTRDDQGEIINVEDDRSIDTAYVRNGWGEVIQESSPDIGTVVYERNELGLITKKTDARSIVANYTYDDAGRLTAISYPAASAENVTYTYDSTTGGNLGVGRLTGFTDPSGVTALTYNSLGLIETRSVTLLSTTFVTTYYYDDAGNLQHIIYPSGRSASYWRDAYGEINSVSTKKTSISALEEIVNEVDWLPFSDQLLSMDFDNGLNLWRTYDTGYRPDQLSLYDGSTALIEHYYGYLDDLNITNIWDNLNSAKDESYWYSATNELQDAGGPWGDDTFYQDGVGNITWHINDNGTTTTDQLTYSGSSNRIASIVRNSSTLRTYTHNNAGNIATSVQGGVTTAYTYNNADRLASFTVGGTQIGAYKYNAHEQLVVRTVTNTSPSGTTVYFYDEAGHPIAEYDGGNGALKREYIWLGDTPIAIIDNGSPSVTYYVHTDHLNRPIAMTNTSKAFVARYVWQAFGALASYTGTKGADLRFPGQMFQAESGLHYNWHRTYDPAIGRYTQPDPIGLEAGISRYAYVGNDPLQQVDPTGRMKAPRTSTPWDMIQAGQSRWRFYDGLGEPWYDIELPGDHCEGPAYHLWINRVRGPEIPFPGVKRK